METPIAFECIAAAHLAGGGGPDKLTVHSGQWAFCPFDVKASGHEWRATGGLPLSMLRHSASLRRTDPVKEQSEP